MWNSFKIAFSMYSKIPMPNTRWNKESIRYAMCFFPLVGIVIGVVMYLFSICSKVLGINDILRSAIYVVIPIIITGGIHVDGYIDTMDAINSYKPLEEKLEILKDSHIGAFALIGAISYFIVSFGFWSEINNSKEVIVISIGFVLSRALSGYSIANFKCAKNSGLASTFSNSTEKSITTIVMYVYIILCGILMVIIDYKYGSIAIFCALLAFFYYKNMSYKKFGGITGDLAGFFLEICELSMLVGVTILKLIVG